MWCLHGHKYPFSYQVAGVLFSVPIAVREGILGKWGAVEPEGGAGSEESLSMAWDSRGKVERKISSIHRVGETVETVSDFIFGAPKSLQMVTAAMKVKDAYSLEGKL